MEARWGLTPALRAAAWNVRVDHSTAEALRAFDRAGVSSVVLRGPAMVRWLYEPGERRLYRDTDLLVAPNDWEAAQRVLSQMGFVAPGELAPTPWWNTHAVEWTRPADAALVDLHYTLQGAGVDPARLWSTLSRHTETLVIRDFPATVLTIPARALTLALHACHHGPGWGPALEELERALARADEATWRAAAGLAAELDATDSFAAGLRLVADGQVLGDRLGLPSEVPLKIALAPGFAPSGALTIERFARASMRRRLAMIRYAVGPPPSFLRGWLRRDLSGRLELARAYAQRAAWLVGRAPAAVGAWRRARRAAQPE